MLDTIKRQIKAVPSLGPMLSRIYRAGRAGDNFDGSASYWEQRYQNRGTSGAGSYNRLAEFKAAFLNDFVARNEIKSVIEFGSGDGAQLQLATYPLYTGVDVSDTAISMCRTRFAGDTTKTFLKPDELPADRRAELAMSLDVIYHLVEDTVFNAYMRNLFATADRFVTIYSSNVDKEWTAKHVRHRKFTTWIEKNEPLWQQDSVTPNAYPYDPADPEHTSFADFYVFKRL